MTDQQEQTSHGICSQATQTIVDLAKSDALYGMLLDSLRTVLQKRQERKQEWSVLIEQRNKVLVDKQGYFNCLFFLLTRPRSAYTCGPFRLKQTRTNKQTKKPNKNKGRWRGLLGWK
ncbi:hypothetical protein ACQJBY_054399 [Aegilops geniculata]